MLRVEMSGARLLLPGAALLALLNVLLRLRVLLRLLHALLFLGALLRLCVLLLLPALLRLGVLLLSLLGPRFLLWLSTLLLLRLSALLLLRLRMLLLWLCMLLRLSMLLLLWLRMLLLLVLLPAGGLRLSLWAFALIVVLSETKAGECEQRDRQHGGANNLTMFHRSCLCFNLSAVGAVVRSAIGSAVTSESCNGRGSAG